MKIKVIIVDQDTNYTEHMLKTFQMRYADKVEMRVFSDVNSFYANIREAYADLVLYSSEMQLDTAVLPDSVVVGYLCGQSGIEEIGGISAICKYQKADILYKLMLGLFAEKASDMKLKTSGNLVHVTLFTSAQGGCGTSAAAAAYALRMAREGRKLFYLNLQKFGSSNLYFSGEGTMSFSDVIYALKSRKSNLLLKIESTVKTDPDGVDFFADCRNAFDMVELKDSEIETLIQGIGQIGEYEEIVVDLSGDLTERQLKLMQDDADGIVYVCDGTMTGIRKFEKFCETLRVIEERKEVQIMNKIQLLYNRYSSKNSMQMEKLPVSLLGGIHRFENVSGRPLIEQIAKMDVLKQVR